MFQITVNERENSATSRTRWAEKHVEDLISPAFVAEFVFRSPQALDHGRDREVADLLITRGPQALLVSQKCQEEPDKRTGEKLVAWVQKHAKSAVSQLGGALRSVGKPGEVWCDHWRRGRVSFPLGLPAISHALAIVEVFQQFSLDANLPLEIGGTPITYLSVSDFVNLSLELRTVPEFVRYLDERRKLPQSELRIVGAEQTLYEYYLLHDGSFAGLSTVEEASRVLDHRRVELEAVLNSKGERDWYAHLIEHVADQLSQRHPRFDQGLSPEVLKMFEASDSRSAYLDMQDALAESLLMERAHLGRVFYGACEQRRVQGPGIHFAAAQIPSQPDMVFLFGAFGESGKFSRDTLLSSYRPLANEAMAHYQKISCLLVVDRDGKSYEVGLARRSEPPPPEQEGMSKLFGPLKMSKFEVHFRPS